MIFVGIDVAKDKHDCHVLNSEGVVICDHFSFPNTRDGFSKFLSLVLGFAEKEKNQLKIGLESTGHYSMNLISFLKSHNLEVVVFNPLSVNKLRTAGTLRKTKTDKSDSRYLAKLLRTGTCNPYHSQSCHIQTLKSLTRGRFRLIKTIQPLKNQYKRLIHILFPELTSCFCKLDIPTVLNLLAILPGAKEIAACDIRTLSSLLSSFSHGKLSRLKAQELKDLAKNSIASYNSGDTLELKFVIENILTMEKQKDSYETKIADLIKEINSPITSIPGIGIVLGATILAEIGDINLFPTADKLLAFAGCEPSTYQSGKYNATTTHMVKRGSRYLRNALYLAANMSYLHNPSFKAYIDKKRSEGKHFYTAMSHGMKKLLRIIFAILTKNVTFQKAA